MLRKMHCTVEVRFCKRSLLQILEILFIRMFCLQIERDCMA